MFITDIHSLGLKTAQGLVLTTGFYWDHDDETRAWSKRWSRRMKAHAHHGPGRLLLRRHALPQGSGGRRHRRGQGRWPRMREIPVNDFFAKNGRIREDGRMVHDMYLVQVKKPEESKYPWDYYKILRVIPGEEAYMPLAESECPLKK